MGSRLVASNQVKAFASLFALSAALTVAMVIAAVIAAALKGGPVARQYGQSACVFASMDACAHVYSAIFDGPDSISAVFVALGPTVALQMIFMLLRAGLSMFHDFEFMAKASSAAFVGVYVPAIVVARFWLRSTLSLYVAMYLPHFGMIALFGWRFVGNMSRFLKGNAGAWTEHSRQLSVSGAPAYPF